MIYIPKDHPPVLKRYGLKCVHLIPDTIRTLDYRTIGELLKDYDLQGVYDHPVNSPTWKPATGFINLFTFIKLRIKYAITCYKSS